MKALQRGIFYRRQATIFILYVYQFSILDGIKRKLPGIFAARAIMIEYRRKCVAVNNTIIITDLCPRAYLLDVITL